MLSWTVWIFYLVIELLTFDCTYAELNSLKLNCLLHLAVYKQKLYNYAKGNCLKLSEVFAHGPGELGSIIGRVILKTQKMVPDSTLLKTQHYKERIKCKVKQSRERSNALFYTLL